MKQINKINIIIISHEKINKINIIISKTFNEINIIKKIIKKNKINIINKLIYKN